MAKIKSRQHVTQTFEPLSGSVFLDWGDNGTGITQNYDPDNDTYYPDHATQPLVLTLASDLKAPDVTGSVSLSVYGGDVTALDITKVGSGWGVKAWLVNGTTLDACGWQSGIDYTLGADGKTLSVLRNIHVNEYVEVGCKAVVTDGRDGSMFVRVTKPVTLGSVSKAEAATVLSVSPRNVNYIPELDMLLDYEYRAARGLEQAMTAEEAARMCYLKTVNVFAAKGDSGRVTTGGYGLILSEEDGNDWRQVAWMKADGTALILDPVRICNISLENILFDCRTIGDRQYRLQLMDSSDNVIAGCDTTITIATEHRAPDMFRLLKNMRFSESDTIMRNRIVMMVNGKELEYPEVYFDIAYKVGNRTIGAGNSFSVDLHDHKTGFGGFDIDYEAEEHKTLSGWVEDGGYITDGNNNVILL